MTDPASAIPHDPDRHRTGEFDSGEPRLDRWLRDFARQGQRRDATRTFVVVDEEDRVIAYYTLVAGEVDHADAAARIRRGMSKHFPIPVCLLARLAVDRRHQGRGLGAAVLADALARAMRAAEQVGIRAVVVNAMHQEASAFYQRFGLEPVSEDSLTLMVTVDQVRRAIALADDDDRPQREEDADWWALREEWAAVFVLLGGYGYRPKLNRQGLVAYRDDESTLVITGTDGQLPLPRWESPLRLTIRGPDGDQLLEEHASFAGDEELVAQIRSLSERLQARSPDYSFIRHFPPATEPERLSLAAAYASYRPELDALAEMGIHAYIEKEPMSLRIYSDVSSNLLLDVSLDDEGLPALGPNEGNWVVFLTTPEGHEAEFTVDRYGVDRGEDAQLLAEAVAHALGRILRGGHIFLEHYDPVRGRLDSHWLRSTEQD